MSCFSHSVFQSITALCWSRGSACLNKTSVGAHPSPSLPPCSSPPPLFSAAHSSRAHSSAARTRAMGVGPSCPASSAPPVTLPGHSPPETPHRGSVMVGYQQEAPGDGAFGTRGQRSPPSCPRTLCSPNGRPAPRLSHQHICKEGDKKPNPP